MKSVVVIEGSIVQATVFFSNNPIPIWLSFSVTNLFEVVRLTLDLEFLMASVQRLLRRRNKSSQIEQENFHYIYHKFDFQSQLHSWQQLTYSG